MYHKFLSIHQLMDISFISSFGKAWVNSINTHIQTFGWRFFVCLFVCLILRSAVLVDKIIVCFNVLRNFQIIFQGPKIMAFCKQYMGVIIDLHPC